MDNIHLLLGHNIRPIRESQRISLRQFSLMTGIDRTYLSGVENGRRNPTVGTLEKIASGLGVSMEALFHDPNANNTNNAVDQP